MMERKLKFLIFSAVGICLAFLSMRAGVLAGPASPLVSGITATDPVNLNTCSTVVIWCNATINDGDGWEDINNVNATLWDPASTAEGSSDSNSNHYTNSSCTLGANVSFTDVPANCSFTLQYYANPADWTCKIYANDTSGNSGSSFITDATINTLRALDAENAIDFGSLVPDSTSPEDANNTVTNCGNVPIDLNLSGTDLVNASAGIANISVSSVKHNVTAPGQDYAAGMSPLSATPTYANFTLAKRTNGLSINKTYWKIGVPSVIEKLIYTGTITFTAVDDN